jgi:hypothetical protein
MRGLILTSLLVLGCDPAKDSSAALETASSSTGATGTDPADTDATDTDPSDTDAEPVAPACAIAAPGAGSRHVEGLPVGLTVVASDPDAPVEEVVVGVAVDGVPRAEVGLVDATGAVNWGGLATLALADLAPGDHAVEIGCVDADGLAAADAIDLVVDPRDAVPIVISGGMSELDYFEADDDLLLTVDGAVILEDTDGSTGVGGMPIAPIALTAPYEAVLRLVATDVRACVRSVTDVWVHHGPEHHLQLVAASSVSGDKPVGVDGPDDCGSRADYDPSAYAPPPPAPFLDVSAPLAFP